MFDNGPAQFDAALGDPDLKYSNEMGKPSDSRTDYNAHRVCRQERAVVNMTLVANGWVDRAHLHGLVGDSKGQTNPDELLKHEPVIHLLKETTFQTYAILSSLLTGGCRFDARV